MSPPPRKPRPGAALGGLTEAGRMLGFDSPLQQAIRRSLVQSPASAPSAQTPVKPRAGHIGPLLELALRLRRQGRWEQSLQTLRTALRLDPSNLAVLCEIGLVLLDGGQLADAIAMLRRVIRLAPDNVVAHYHLGFALERRGNTVEAAAAYRRAVELSPQFSDSVARLAEALTDLDRCEEAVAVLTEAAERMTGTAARLHRAHAKSLSGRYSDAEAELRAALTADPGNREILLRLGKMQRMRGDFEHARATFRRILERETRWPGAWIDFIKSGRFAAADCKLLDRLVGLLDGGEWAVNDRMGLQFAVGKAFDDLNDHARAMQAFEAANEIRARFWPCDRARHERRFARQQTLFSAEALAGHRGLGTDDARPIFIVGMPRSGTTLVEQILSSHPDVAAGGELRFWGAEGPAWGAAVARNQAASCAARLAENYSALLRRISPDATRVTDKMPFNYGWIGLIRIVFPTARIIHCRRNPIDTCLSIFMTDFSTLMDFASRRADLVFYYQQYQQLMAHWRQVLPPDSMFDLDYEQLVADRETVTRQLVEWCRLRWNAACLQPERNERIIETASLWQARQPVYTNSVERWRQHEPWLGELKQLLPEKSPA